MMLLRSLLVWLVIITVETVHGILRRLVLVPMVGEQVAHQIGVLVGSVLVLCVVWVCFNWLRVYRVYQQLLVGFLWGVLTLFFELLLAYSLGLSTHRVWSEYNPKEGGLMLVGMLTLFLSLVIVSRARGERVRV